MIPILLTFVNSGICKECLNITLLAKACLTGAYVGDVLVGHIRKVNKFRSYIDTHCLSQNSLCKEQKSSLRGVNAFQKRVLNIKKRT